MLMGVATIGINHGGAQCSKTNTCAMNVETIENAKELWAMECKKDDDAIARPTDLLSHLKNNRFPVCPLGGTYSINANNIKATCSHAGLTNAPAARNPRLPPM